LLLDRMGWVDVISAGSVSCLLALFLLEARGEPLAAA
jgi:hypothetical protein